MVRKRTSVAGPVAIEGEPTGDGRMIEMNALTWDGVLPYTIIWDPEDGNHSGAVLGAIESMARRPNGVIWADGYVEDSDVPEFQALVERVCELLEQGAVGVSLALDSATVEVRVKRELIEVDAVHEASIDEQAPEYDENEERVTVARFSADDALYVTTSARCRHLAIVNTAAIVTPENDRFGIAASGMLHATGAIAASALAGDWSGREYMFADPEFGDITTDPRLRYDPERGLWSCPPTVTDDGHYFGHITPMGICLRGRPDKCVSPPDGDLDGFMRGRAPAAGGLRTGVVTVVDRGQHGHCQTGIGTLAATMFYDGGWGAADVRVGRDQYGIWFSGMVRPGTTPEQAYQLCAADVSGHWEYPLQGLRNRATLVGLPCVDVGGFPKGYLTYQEYIGGLAASAAVDVTEGCGAWVMEPVAASGAVEDDFKQQVLSQLANLSTAIGDLWAATLAGK